jgi:Mor family transcriptional regulator
LKKIFRDMSSETVRSVSRRNILKKRIGAFHQLSAVFSGEDMIQKFLENYTSASSQKHSCAKEILEQLFADGIIEEKRLRNYMIVMDYYKYLSRHEGHSTKAIAELSELYKMSSRQIQNVLYKWSDKFRR